MEDFGDRILSLKINLFNFVYHFPNENIILIIFLSLLYLTTKKITHKLTKNKLWIYNHLTAMIAFYWIYVLMLVYEGFT